MGVLKDGDYIIVGKRAERSSICCGYGYDAEIAVDRLNNGRLESFYITCRMYEGTYYGVSKTSIFDEENWEPVFLEEYFDLFEAKKSVFGNFFEMADKLIAEIDVA